MQKIKPLPHLMQKALMIKIFCNLIGWQSCLTMLIKKGNLVLFLSRMLFCIHKLKKI